MNKVTQIVMLGAAAVTLLGSQAFADSVYMGQPGYGGTGCPNGTVSAVLSPDNQALSILFDAYVVEAGRAAAKSFDRKACQVAIPVHVPQGYSVSIFAIDFRGFNGLPRGATSTFNVEYFFAGRMGPRYSKRFYGAQTQDFLLHNDLIASAVVWSGCGEDVNLRANTNLLVQGNSAGDQALMSLDSADIQAGVIYHLQWKRCGAYGRY